jgi:hypothetical protein
MSFVSRADDRPRGANADRLTAEVLGTLRFESGRGYFVAVKRETTSVNVWLQISEDKVMARKLSSLVGKKVTVRGDLYQMPENATASVPKLGLYSQRFEIVATE